MTASPTASLPTAPPLPATPIAVALSGGADSLYTLLRLKEEGAKLMGVHGLFGQRILARFMKHANLPPLFPSFEEMTEQLNTLCDSLGIPFHLIDCENLFLENVIKPFVQTYIQGGTPNPCALCNATVKLGDLLRQCLALGASHLATGHYARCLQTPMGPVLMQGSDPAKDQSYFLALTPKEQLAKILFPAGSRLKKDVLAELASQNISPPQQGESQEICFIPGNLYREFLPFMAGELGLSLPGSGKICLENDTCLGDHQGLWQYTEGQRRGIGIGWKEPLHVLAKEQDTNILRVGPKSALQTSSFACEEINMLIPPSHWPGKIYVKTRYREHPQPAKVLFSRNDERVSAHVTYENKSTSVSCGQLAAMYIPYENYLNTDLNSQLCVAAGGIITSSER